MVIPVSRLSASCASGDLEGKTNDLASVMKERLDRRDIVGIALIAYLIISSALMQSVIMHSFHQPR